MNHGTGHKPIVCFFVVLFLIYFLFLKILSEGDMFLKECQLVFTTQCILTTTTGPVMVPKNLFSEFS